MTDWAPEPFTTGIGSMPFSEPGKALEIVLKTCPRIPHWPQLPKRTPAEGFVLQCIVPLLNSGLVKVFESGPQFDAHDKSAPERLAAFYERYLSAQRKLTDNKEAGTVLADWVLPPESAAGFYTFLDHCRNHLAPGTVHLKGQMAGPVTMALQIKGPDGLSALYDEQSMDVLTKALAMHAAWQTTTLAAVLPKPLVFVDEPGLGIYGRSMHIAVTKAMIQTALGEVMEAIHAAGGSAGVHCCDAIDWTLLFETEADIVSFDAYTYGNTLLPYARELARFFKRGGRVAWGIVPTAERVTHETAASLADRLRKLWSELTAAGVPAASLEKNVLLTPACGTGALGLALAERVYALLGEMPAAMADAKMSG